MTFLYELFSNTASNIQMKDHSKIISDTNCEGENFTKNWPWAAVNLMSQHKSLVPFLHIANNPDTIVPTVSKLLCCSGLEDCKKAQYFAKEMPRYAECSVISKLLGKADNKKDMLHRAILLDVNYDEKGELFQRIANAPRYAKEQLVYATNNANYLQAGSIDHLLGKLMVAVLAGTDIDPRDVPNFRVFYRALEVVSLTCFALNYQAQCETFTPSYNHEFYAGTLSILKMLYTNKPVPTPYQLARFAKHVDDNVFSYRNYRRYRDRGGNVCGNGVIQMDIKNLTWPAPPGWDSEMGLQGQIVPLLSTKCILQEGKENKNCLETDMDYIIEAACGEIALFSLRFNKARATLMLNMHKKSKKQLKFDIGELKGPGNAKPTSKIKNASDNLVAQLNRRQSLSLPKDNYPLQIDHLNSLIIPKGTSHELWNLFSSVLPNRFQSYSKLVSCYTDALRTIRNDYDQTICELRS